MSKASNTVSRKRLGKVPFTVSGRIIKQLGRDNIASSIGAIVEIVKNSYDADAERVHIKFTNIHTQSPTIEIIDDGDGMDHSTLVERWMHIGDSSKVQLERSRSKERVLTGEKGMGRLGLDRLAQIASVRSFVANENSGVEILIDWSQYDEQPNNIGAVKHPTFSIPKTQEDRLLPPKRKKQPKKGTILTLTELRDTWASRKDEKWDYSYLKDLRKELSLLVSPFSEVEDFEICIISDAEDPEINGPVTAEEIIKGAWRVTASLSTKGVVTFRVVSEDNGIDKPISYTSESFFRGKPQCGPLRFEMYHFPRSRTNDIGIDSARINKFLDDNQGIRIYRDGFRVRPYGAPSGEGDWLNLSFRRQRRNVAVSDRQWKVGYKQVVGALFIGRLENPGLIDQTNREGLVEGTAYNEARTLCIRAVEYFEQERSSYEREELKREREESGSHQRDPSANDQKDPAETAGRETRQLGATATEVFRKIETEVETLLSMAGSGDPSVDWEEKRSTIEVLLADAKQTQELLQAATDAERDEFERQKDTLANLASLGILAATFGHETIGATNSVITNAGLLQLYLTDIIFANLDLKERAERAASVVVRESRKIDTFAKFALRNVGRDKRTRTKIQLDKIAQEVLVAFEEPFKTKNIVVTAVYESVPPILGFRIDWESVIVNFITNSIWALEDTPAEKRTVSLSMMKEGDKISFRFSDTGRGLEPGSEERIFEPTVSTKRNRRGDVIGTGMGLTIVKNFVEAHEGSVTARNNDSGAEFHVLIPIPKLESRGTPKGGKDEE